MVPVLIGGGLTLGGGLLGSWVGERRAVAREERDRAHEREVWARSLRYEAHLQFLSEFDHRYKAIAEAKARARQEPVPDDWLDPAWDRLKSLRLVCAEQSAQTAEHLLLIVGEYSDEKAIWEDVEVARRQYVDAIRAEFHMPPIALRSDAI